MQKIFDTHCKIGRFGKQKIKGFEVEPFKDREITNNQDVSAYIKKYKITKLIVAPHYTQIPTQPFKEYNPLVLEATKLKNVYGSLFVSPLPELIKLTKKALQKLDKKIIALKIAPSSWPKGITANPETWPNGMKENMSLIAETAKKHNLIIQTHTGENNSTPIDYENFVKEFGANLKIQFLHAGGSGGNHLAFVPRFIQWLKQCYNFYTDVSFSKDFGPLFLIKELEEKYPKGLERVLFATDTPWGFFPATYSLIKESDFSEKIKENIFYNNANKLYG